jgi:hypothetical protein
MGWSGEGVWKSDNGGSSGGGAAAADGAFGVYGNMYSAAKGDYSGGGDGGGFSPFGMGGKSGALGKYDYLGKELDKSNPWLNSDKDRKAAEEEARQRAELLYQQTGAINKHLDEADKTYGDEFGTKSSYYLNQAKGLTDSYTSKINGLNDQAQRQANDATATYTNTIFPEMKNAMELQKQNAQGAMTLEEASDPNNKVQTAIRAMYDQLGQQVRQQGQQDFGVLSALGAQGAAQQFGAAGPMTAGQQGQIYARGQEQAGNAYSKAQQRMFDLQQQGINRGFDQNNFLYQQGEQARNDYGKSVLGLQDVEHNYESDQAAYRGEQSGYAGDILGANSAYNTDKYNMGMLGADIGRQNTYASDGRDLNSLNQLYGNEQTAANNNLQAGLANNASKGQFMSSLASMFAGGWGGLAGNAAMQRRPQQDPYSPNYQDNYPQGTNGYSSTGYQPNVA